MEPFELSLRQAADQIRGGQLSPVELTDSVLSRIADVDERVGAFAIVTVDQAQRAARDAEKEIANGGYRGPLHGVCVGVKDLFNTAGISSTSSSRTRHGYVPAADAAMVEHLAAAGAIMVGKTQTHEFAYGVITPSTRNPWDPGRIPGGSSGGSGAAVAAQMCPGAIGTDTGGSVRIPSAACGTVGLKPTYGRTSRRGLTLLSWSLDHVGPLARTVEDTAVMMDALAGYDRADPATCDEAVPNHSEALVGEPRKFVLGVPRNYFFESIDSEVETTVRTAIQKFQDLGAELREIDLPYAELYLAAWYGILVPEASAYHQQTLREHGDLLEDDVRMFFEAGELMLATDYIKALRARGLIQQGWRKMFTELGLDAVLAPTLPAVAATVGQETFSWPDGSEESVINAYVRTSAPANLTGLPAISLPCGFNTDGLPVGLQIIGKPFAEPTVLRIGAAYETATDWPTHAPTPQV